MAEGVGTSETEKLSLFNNYYSLVDGLRREDNGGARVALNKSKIHKSWTDEALDVTNEDSWFKLVEAAKTKEDLADTLQQFELLVDLSKPVGDGYNGIGIRELRRKVNSATKKA